MAFKTNQRIEQIYFDNIRKELDVLKKWKDGETDLKTADVLQAVIDADSAIIMLYKNLGEAYAETVSLIEKEAAELETMKAEFSSFNTEINSKIDEVNNYLNGRISELEGRVANIEHELASILKFILVRIVKNATTEQYEIHDEINSGVTYSVSQLSGLIENGYSVIAVKTGDTIPLDTYYRITDYMNMGGEITIAFSAMSAGPVLGGLGYEIDFILLNAVEGEDTVEIMVKNDILTGKYNNLSAELQPDNSYFVGYSENGSLYPLTFTMINDAIQKGQSLRLIFENNVYYLSEFQNGVRVRFSTLMRAESGNFAYDEFVANFDSGSAFCRFSYSNYTFQL